MLLESPLLQTTPWQKSAQLGQLSVRTVGGRVRGPFKSVAAQHAVFRHYFHELQARELWMHASIDTIMLFS